MTQVLGHCFSCGADFPRWYTQEHLEPGAERPTDEEYQAWLDRECETCGCTPRMQGVK